ncbi:MAG: alpha/beta hydrolase [Filomicrobium sp.]
MALLDETHENRSFNSILSASVDAAGDLAYERFCTPHLSDRRASDHEAQVSRTRKHLRHATQRMVETRDGKVCTYILEPEKAASNSGPVETVLVIHGWTCEASFMAMIAESLRRAGFRVLLVDLPAHGLSPGVTTSIVSCARAVTDVIDHYGSVDFTVSHSLGGLVSLLASAGGKAVGKARPMRGYVFISMPNDFCDIMTEFADSLRLSGTAVLEFEKRLEHTAQYPLHELNAARFIRRINRPALLIHCADDNEVTIENAHDVAAAGKNVQVEEVRGLGHRKILFASNVARNTARFLKQLSSETCKTSAAPLNVSAFKNAERIVSQPSGDYRQQGVSAQA